MQKKKVVLPSTAMARKKSDNMENMQAEHPNTWQALNFEEIQETLESLHQWIQIVGKIRLRTMPWQNHSWHAALYITNRGFSTHSIPYQGHSHWVQIH